MEFNSGFKGLNDGYKPSTKNMKGKL